MEASNNALIMQVKLINCVIFEVSHNVSSFYMREKPSGSNTYVRLTDSIAMAEIPTDFLKEKHIFLSIYHWA